MIPYARVSHRPNQSSAFEHCDKGRWANRTDDLYRAALSWIGAREYAILHAPNSLANLDAAWLAYRDADAGLVASREYDFAQALMADPAIGAFAELHLALHESLYYSPSGPDCTIDWHRVGCYAAWLASKTPDERVQIVQAARDGAKFSPICPTVETDVTYGQQPMTLAELPPVAQPEPAKPKPSGMSTLGKVAMAVGAGTLILVAGIATTRGM